MEPEESMQVNLNVIAKTPLLLRITELRITPASSLKMLAWTEKCFHEPAGRIERKNEIRNQWHLGAGRQVSVRCHLS